ncbi:hypothetical protein HY503_00965 [Candidatus Woesebacteria bacterium]|nr:hypothetical protein [Candidatus Woesebacteria bacterium]
MEDRSELTPSKSLEINALRRVRNVVVQHGGELKGAYKSKSRSKFYEIAKKGGFKPREVPIGTIFINTKGQQDMVTRYNPASMGQGNILYVGVEGGKLVSFDGLAHDVAAILLGEMRPHPDWSSTISISTFNEVAQNSVDRSYSVQELSRMKTLILDEEKRPVVAATRLLDAIVFDKSIPFRAIKYA